jgi:hypothetical protein
MARTANPYTKVLKRLSKLQDKSNKLNAEIAAISSMVEQQSKMLSASKVIAGAKKASTPNLPKADESKKAQPQKAQRGKAPIAKEVSANKKPTITTKQVSEKAPKGRKTPALPDGGPDHLATLNRDNVSEPPKPRGKKATMPKAPKI